MRTWEMGSIIGREFRKTATITVLEKAEYGYLVYDGVNKNDTWIIPFDVFAKTYEELK